jgi:hypothetical protein
MIRLVPHQKKIFWELILLYAVSRRKSTPYHFREVGLML